MVVYVNWLSDCMGVVECLNTSSSSPFHGDAPSCGGGHPPPRAWHQYDVIIGSTFYLWVRLIFR